MLEQFFFGPAPHHGSNGVDPEDDGVDSEDDHTDAWIAALRRDGPDLLTGFDGNWQDLLNMLGVVWNARAFTLFVQRSLHLRFESRRSERVRSVTVKHSIDNSKRMAMVAYGSAHMSS